MKNVVYFNWKLTPEHPFSCMEMSYPARIQPSVPDMHSALHLGLVLDGYSKGIFSGEEIKMSAGEFYLTAPWEVHHTVSTSCGYRLLLFNISWDSLQKCFFTGTKELEQLLMMKPAERMKFFNEKVRNSPAEAQLLESAGLPESPHRELLLWSLLQQLFITALPELESDGGYSSNYQRLLPALKALSGKKLSVTEAAERCNLSPNYFAVVFKERFGLSFARYERNFRLNGAIGAISRGASLKEAADAWGYCDKSHLAKALKKRS